MESLDKNGNPILGTWIAIWMCVFFAFIAVLIGFWINGKFYLHKLLNNLTVPYKTKRL